jgi:dephospho-CoA kinase
MENENFKQMKIAITGGIGSGKSVVAKIILSYGYPVYNSDEKAKALMENDLTLKNKLIAAFDKNIYFDGKLNRKYLAEQVFNSNDNLHKINKLVHKAVFKDFAKFTKESPQRLVFMESAIIFENSLEKHFDYVIAILASQKIRIQRVMQRSGMPQKEILQRIQQQKSIKELKQLSNFKINNNGDAPLLPQIDTLINNFEAISANCLKLPATTTKNGEKK